MATVKVGEPDVKEFKGMTESSSFYVSEFTIRSGNVRVYESTDETVSIENLSDDTVIDICIDDIEAITAALLELKRNLLNKG